MPSGNSTTKRLFVYIAGPYTGGDQVLNVRAAIAAGQAVLDAGHIPFVPHLYHLWHTIYPGGYEQWMTLDFAWLAKCDIIIRLPGESSGADREVEAAREQGLDVIEIEPCPECVEEDCEPYLWRAMHEGDAFTGETVAEAIQSVLETIAREAA